MSAIGYKTILDGLITTLEAANTTTADYYLSENMDSKIVNICKKNPAFIVEQPSKFPAICVRLNDDSKTYAEVGRTTNPKQSLLDINIIGMLWYNSLDQDNISDDTSDDQIHYLAENIEEVIRATPRLQNSVLYSYIENIRFYEDLDEEAYFRTTVLNLKARVFY